MRQGIACLYGIIEVSYEASFKIMKKAKLLQKLMSGSKNIKFSELTACAEAFGFKLDRINGSHHIYTPPSVNELINLQNVNGKAKPYQIKQFLQTIERYNLNDGDN